jgi:hypothetical protein
MSEVYKVDGSKFLPLNSQSPDEIDMPVHTVNNATKPVYRIFGYAPPALKSQEYNTTKARDRYADIYFTTDQFTLLEDRLKHSKAVWISYDVDAKPGNEPISHQSVLTNFP